MDQDPERYFGLDGQIVGLEREPLSEAVMADLRGYWTLRGWRPYSIGPWYWRCPNGHHHRTTSTAPGLCNFGVCCVTRSATPVQRNVRLWSPWRPWTWGRPTLIDIRGVCLSGCVNKEGRN